jgi:hypothetical protein
MKNARETGIVLAHAFVIWVLCSATMGIGMAVTPLETALIIHLVAAPIIAAAVSWVYFTRFSHATPMQTALVFVVLVILMDFFVVALLVQKSLDMFKSFIGTQLPFGLIFTATYIVGIYITRRQAAARREA